MFTSGWFALTNSNKFIHIVTLRHNKTIISGEMLGTPTQCHTVVIYDDTGQKTRLN